MNEFERLTKDILDFRAERDWQQFHTPKDEAISLTLEAAEVLEHVQWRGPEELKKYIETNRQDIGEELADVLFWVLLMCHDFKIDLVEAFDKKMLQNKKKYPVEKAKGRHTKYTHL